MKGGAKMYVDVWNVIAKQERELNSIQKLWKLKLIKPSTDVAILMAYYDVSNSVLKTLLKTKVRLQALLRRSKKISKKTSAQPCGSAPRPTHISYHILFLLEHRSIRIL